jgi:hypothetical protein
MKPVLHRCLGQLPPRFNGLTAQRFKDLTFHSLLVLGALLLPWSVGGQTTPNGTITARSVSGRFIVTGVPSRPGESPLAAMPEIATNASFVRLQPALLAVSAERIRESLRRELDIPPNPPGRGKIFLALHPAQSLDENVTIVSEPFAGGWNYHVALPDVLSRVRFARAMTGVLLLELANRAATAQASAEIPAWLIDGLSQPLLAPGTSETILSSPDKMVNGLPVSRTMAMQHGLDPLAGARRVLRDCPALTFGQLGWPTDAQLSDADGGVYRASAQLFVSKLLKLKDGPAHLRAMLETLPQFYNWQVAFQTAFRTEFPRPLELEKWWALQVVNFVTRDSGPQWTPAVSREKLDGILSVPVEMRTASNNLPAHVEVSLQAVIRNWDSARRTAVLQVRLRDLELAQLRMAAPLAGLTDEYRRALADYLGQGRHASPAVHLGKHAPVSSPAILARDTLERLDALDARRRTVESAIKPDVLAR